MTGRRRQVVASQIVTALVVALVTAALGNMLAVGCILAWLWRTPDGTATGALAVFGAAAAAQLVAAVAAMFAWLWSR